MKLMLIKGELNIFLEQMHIMIIAIHDISIRELREYFRKLVEEEEKKK